MRRALLACLAVAAACSRSSTSAPPPRDSTVVTYLAGQSYFGTSRYIEYIAGDAPVIFTAPHGGAVLPASIPDRTAALCGGAATTTTDLNTVELARAMQARYFARFGRYPHVVVAHIARRKADVNRVAPEATCGNAEADVALREWHTFIDVAKRAVLTSSGKGWYMDMHGHGHAIQRLELGYLLDGLQLDLPNDSLDARRALADTASIRTIVRTGSLPFSALLRGPTSLGTLYGERGFPAIPSAQDPRPNGAVYFSGGDNTRRHTCGAEASAFGGVTEGLICGVQIESNLTGVRDNAANRDRFGDVTAAVLEVYLLMHLGLRLGAR